MINQGLKKYFWDTDFATLDAEKHKRYVIERILEFGDDAAAEWLQKTFSKSDILEALEHTRNVSKRSLRFWRIAINRS